MNIKILGKIKTIFPEETFGNFKKIVVWIDEVEVQWPNTYEVQFVQAKTVELDGYKEGELVELDVDVRGRYSKKDDKEYVFNSLTAWRIQRIGQGSQTTQEAPGGSELPPIDTSAKKEDDLPF